MTQWELVQDRFVRGSFHDLDRCHEVAEFFESQGFGLAAERVRDVASEIASDWADQ